MINAYELSVLKKTFRNKTELWKQAFSEYNEGRLTLSDGKLSMNCAPCWFKVLKWHEKRIMQGSNQEV